MVNASNKRPLDSLSWKYLAKQIELSVGCINLCYTWIQSHWIYVARWSILMEHNLRFGLVLRVFLFFIFPWTKQIHTYKTRGSLHCSILTKKLDNTKVRKLHYLFQNRLKMVCCTNRDKLNTCLISLNPASSLITLKNFLAK